MPSQPKRLLNVYLTLDCSHIYYPKVACLGIPHFLSNSRLYFNAANLFIKVGNFALLLTYYFWRQLDPQLFVAVPVLHEGVVSVKVIYQTLCEISFITSLYWYSLLGYEMSGHTGNHLEQTKTLKFNQSTPRSLGGSLKSNRGKFLTFSCIGISCFVVLVCVWISVSLGTFCHKMVKIWQR